MTEMGRNICRELGCPASCCHDVWIEVGENEEGKLKRLFPHMMKVPYGDLADICFSGVYYIDYASKNKDGFLVRICGRCPYLMPDFSCGTHSDRLRACSDTQIGSKYCDEARKKGGALPLSQNLVRSLSSETEK